MADEPMFTYMPTYHVSNSMPHSGRFFWGEGVPFGVQRDVL